MNKIKELLESGYKIAFAPVDKEIFQVTIVSTKSKERGYLNKAMHYNDKKVVKPFELRLSEFIDAGIEEIEAAEKAQREKHSQPKEENV